MADLPLRDLHRRAATDGPEARAHLLAQRVRAGELSPEQLEDLARVGDPAARHLLLDKAPDLMGFVAVAERFCSWGRRGADSFTIQQAMLELSDLHREAVRIPDVFSELDRVYPEIGPVEAGRFAEHVSHLPVSSYWLIFSPLAHPAEEPVMGLLMDDLGDVYRDVEVGNLLYREGQCVEAAWHWRFSFWTHWGRHAIDALRAMHDHLG